MTVFSHSLPTSDVMMCSSCVGSWCHFHTSLPNANTRGRWSSPHEAGRLCKEDMDQQHSVSDYFMVCVWTASSHQQWCWGVASSSQQESIRPDTTILWSGNTSTCWGRSHTHTDKVGIWGKAISLPETTVPYQFSKHYATMGPVFKQGDHYNQLLKRCGRINSPILDNWTSQTFWINYIDINM